MILLSKKKQEKEKNTMNIKEKKKEKTPLGKKNLLPPELTSIKMLGEQSNQLNGAYVPVTTFRLLFPTSLICQRTMGSGYAPSKP